MEYTKTQTENEQLLAQIKRGDPRVLEQLYKKYRPMFITWAESNFDCDEDDAVDIFQRSFTFLYYNIKDDKLTTLTSSLKTYLFSIGRNLFRAKFRDKHSSLLSIEGNMEVDEKMDSNILDDYNHAHEKELVRKLLNKIGDPCKTLLELIYIHNYAVESIVEEMDYSDERVVRKRKCLCLKRLREMIVEVGDDI